MRPRSHERQPLAASNIEIEGTGVTASTVHNVYDLDGDLQTKIDFNKRDNKKVAILLHMFALLCDEVSMLDTDLWGVMEKIMTLRQNAVTPGQAGVDGFGNIHLLLFGDFKQEPNFSN